MGIILLLAAAAFVCFLPAIIASSRSHHNTAAITCLCLLAGWTGLGWLIAMVWALTAVQKQVGR
jgi:hypothetical protein